jgi:hypothetical protein
MQLLKLCITQYLMLSRASLTNKGLDVQIINFLFCSLHPPLHASRFFTGLQPWVKDQPLSFQQKNFYKIKVFLVHITMKT